MTSNLIYPIEPSLSRRTLPLPAESIDVRSAYDGSNAVFKLLRMESWGPALLNLGHYRFRGILSFLNLWQNLEFAQRRLVIKSVELLGISGNQRILDVACGRGKSSFIISCMQPNTTVIGLDLLDSNVQVARTLFGQLDNLSYQVGNAQDLHFPDEAFDRVVCIEAAFHFPDRARFIAEASRVLRPGGRLVVVDFTWKSDAATQHCNDPETRLVRKIWQWTDLYSIPEYERVAQEAGLTRVTRQDWSHAVTAPIQTVFQLYSNIGNTKIGRKFLGWLNPLYRSISTSEWRELAAAVRAHAAVQRHTRYTAFVFKKQ